MSSEKKAEYYANYGGMTWILKKKQGTYMFSQMRVSTWITG